MIVYAVTWELDSSFLKLFRAKELAWRCIYNQLKHHAYSVPNDFSKFYQQVKDCEDYRGFYCRKMTVQ